jgi:hypothetical protein
MTTKYEALKNRIASWKEKGQEQMGHALQAVEVGATAFGFGFMRGKMGDANGDLDIAGVPASLGAAIALHGLGFMNVFGKHSEHAHNIADGALAEYASVQGMRMGAARSTDFAGQRRIAGRSRVAGLPSMQQQNPFAQRAGMAGFARSNIQNPFVRQAA